LRCRIERSASKKVKETLPIVIGVIYRKFNYFKKEKVMNTLRNRVQLIGNLGTAPEVKTINGNRKVAKLVIATNETYKNQKGERVTETTWHNITAWGTNAEFAEKYLEKGAEIAIDGKLKNNSYTDKNGDKRYVTEIIVNEFMMIGKKK
jgi:single-strand DNA-binding protein